MNIHCRDADIREELEKVSNRSPSIPLGNSEQDLCACFDFIPVEDYDKLYKFAQTEKMKADAFKDVMLTLLKYINFTVENTTVISSSRLAVTAYQETFNVAISRIEALEHDLEHQTAPATDYF